MILPQFVPPSLFPAVSTCPFSMYASLFLPCISRSSLVAQLVKIPCFNCRGYGFHPWSGKFHMLCYAGKEKKQPKHSFLNSAVSPKSSLTKGLPHSHFNGSSGKVHHPKLYFPLVNFPVSESLGHKLISHANHT